ncbi:MAG: flagellar basal body-associated FliL family protein [Roseburia sp.]
MKKNLMSVLILALVLVNLILTAILTISILPQTKKANELITTVCSAINLELASGDVTESSSSVPMSQSATYAIENTMTISLKKGADGKQHYVVLGVSVSMDTKSDGYKDYGAAVEAGEYDSIICDTVDSVVSGYTLEEFEDRDAVKQDILKQLQSRFESDFIYQVNFSSVTPQ